MVDWEFEIKAYSAQDITLWSYGICLNMFGYT